MRKQTPHSKKFQKGQKAKFVHLCAAYFQDKGQCANLIFSFKKSNVKVAQ